MKSCLQKAASPMKVYDITPIVQIDNYNILRSHFRQKSCVVVLLRRTYKTACRFDYFHLSCDHLVFHNGTVMQMKQTFCESYPKAACRMLSKFLQDSEFWNCRICEQAPGEDAVEAYHCIQCGNLLCYDCLKQMLFVKAHWQAGSSIPIACPVCRNPQAFICNMNEVGPQREIQVDVYGLSPTI